VTSLVEEPSVTRTRVATLLELRQLVVEYGADAKGARAVDGVDLAIHEGEIVGLAGESGCGKTTIANAVMQILRPPGRIAGGSILFEGESLVGKSAEELRRFRWRSVSMVLQSAMNALIRSCASAISSWTRCARTSASTGVARSRARASCSSSSASTAGVPAPIRTSFRVECASE